MNGARERERQDGLGLLFKEVREEMGNKRLGGLLLWQAIHSNSTQLEKRAEVGEWESDDRKMSVARREMICRLVLWYCTSRIVL